MSNVVDEVGKAKRFWLDGQQRFGRIVAVDSDAVLVEYQGRHYEVVDEAAVDKGFDSRNTPERWRQKETPHPDEQSLPLSESGGAGAESVEEAPDEPLGSGVSVGTGDFPSTVKAGAAVGAEQEAAEEKFFAPPAGGVQIGLERGTEDVPAPETGAAGEGGPGGAPEKPKRARQPKTPVENGAKKVEFAAGPVVIECLSCGEQHERYIKPAEEKGMFELSSARKAEVVSNPCFLPCAKCREPIAVKIVPVTVYSVLVAGFPGA